MSEEIKDIRVVPESECCGCAACANACPVDAIRMEEGKEGFVFPKVDLNTCIQCGKCVKTCPVLEIDRPNRKEPDCRAAYGADEIRKVSSSGAIFTLLADYVFQRGGVVYGVALNDEFEIEHRRITSMEELSALRRSKYVQSRVGLSYRQVKQDLKNGKTVLFSGTPCQNAGLRKYLGRTDTEKLILADIVCHGVPSPGVFASYLVELEKKHGSRVSAYTFRDKRLGWKNFSAVATFENGEEHAGTQTTEPYLYGFLQNLYLRPSCHSCSQLRGERHAADITLADLWGAEKICPERDDDTGLSFVMANTQKGRQALEQSGMQLNAFSIRNFEGMTRANPSLLVPVKPHEKRAAFFKRYQKHGFESERVMKLLRGPNATQRVMKRVLHLPIGAMRRIKNRISK